MNYLFFIIGLVLLVKGADFFVDGSSAIAEKLQVPKLIIGLTIVAFGTSAPEAAVSIVAALKGQNDIALTNILGSNIFNLLAIMGVVAMIRPVKVHKSIIVKEFPFAILACFMLLVLATDGWLDSSAVNMVSRSEGLILLMVFGIFVYSILVFALGTADKGQNSQEGSNISMGKSALKTVGGLVAIVAGGKVVVDSAVLIAQSLHISNHIIGLTVVAVGTSLPELVTSLVAIKKDESDIALGNVVGSNIFNTFFILGISAFIAPMSVNTMVIYDLIFVTLISVVCYLFAYTKQKINRKEGIVMLMLYVGYVIFAIFR